MGGIRSLRVWDVLALASAVAAVALATFTVLWRAEEPPADRWRQIRVIDPSSSASYGTLYISDAENDPQFIAAALDENAPINGTTPHGELACFTHDEAAAMFENLDVPIREDQQACLLLRDTVPPNRIATLSEEDIARLFRKEMRRFARQQETNVDNSDIIDNDVYVEAPNNEPTPVKDGIQWAAWFAGGVALFAFVWTLYDRRHRLPSSIRRKFGIGAPEGSHRKT